VKFPQFLSFLGFVKVFCFGKIRKCIFSMYFFYKHIYFSICCEFAEIHIFFCSYRITEEREARLITKQNLVSTIDNTISFCFDNLFWIDNTISFCFDNLFWIDNTISFCFDNLFWIDNTISFCFDNFDIYAIFEFFGFCKSVLFWENQKVYFSDVFFWKDFQKSDFSEIAGMYIFFCSDLITEEREARLFSNKTHNLNNKSIPFCVDIIDIPIIIMLYFLRFCIEIQYEI